jgi:hypothetical protein
MTAADPTVDTSLTILGLDAARDTHVAMISIRKSVKREQTRLKEDAIKLAHPIDINEKSSDIGESGSAGSRPASRGMDAVRAVLRTAGRPLAAATDRIQTEPVS